MNNWTHELLDLMVRKLTERKQREVDAMAKRSGQQAVSAEQLAARSHGMIEVVKNAGN